ncbi:MAG TPA: type III pantothenate kinase [Gemmataceae bacterium]|nr:type III pantothenate kinase [Gemmataceae bacterium]
MVDIVVDIGNSRIKWGRIADRAVAASASLPPDAPAAWEKQLAQWRLIGPLRWVVACVCPPCLVGFLAWLRARGDTVRLIEHAAELPLVVKVPEPDKVGIDRLLAAVGANARRAAAASCPDQGAIVVGVGTAITVDLLDPAGAFLGGAILPGPRLMAQALHDHAALLPLVETIPSCPTAPATATRPAIELGIHWAMVGGINGLIAEMGRGVAREPGAVDVFVTGGGAPLVLDRLLGKTRHCPELILEGICLTAEALS